MVGLGPNLGVIGKGAPFNEVNFTWNILLRYLKVKGRPRSVSKGVY